MLAFASIMNTDEMRSDYMHCRRPGQQKKFIEVVCSEPAKITQASKKDIKPNDVNVPLNDPKHDYIIKKHKVPFAESASVVPPPLPGQLTQAEYHLPFPLSKP